MPKFKFDKVFVNTIESQHTNIEFIPPEYEDDINSIVNFLPKWPSTGVMGMHFAIHHFDEVFLYGFDSFDVKYDTQHYFEDETAEYGKNKYKLNPASDHIPLKEKEYINYMVKNNKLNIL